MTRNTLNFATDLFSALVMAGMIATGLVLRFALPPGSGGRMELWGWNRHDWGGVHFWLAVGTAVVLVLHVALHWQWVCVTVLRCVPGRAGRMPPSTPMRRNAAGATFLAALLGIFGTFVWVASRSVTDIHGGGGEGHGRDMRQIGPTADDPAADQRDSRGERVSIRGSMSLSEAAVTCGITVETARDRLGLPRDVPADERLGRLSARYGFPMNEARQRLLGARPDS